MKTILIARRPLITALDNRINRKNRFFYHGKKYTVNPESVGVSEHNERKTFLP